MGSSTSSLRSYEHDVFLSFRGEDTRDNFTSHLLKELRDKRKIDTFIDDDLKRGNEILPSLSKAIEGSKISIIIFSKDYAASKWCLNELVKILECKEMNGQIVIPVFYRVDPSDVRHQSGRFGEGFRKTEKEFKKMPDKVQKWGDNLAEASHICGYHSKEIRRESELVDKIADDVLTKLRHMSVSNDFEGFIGLYSQIKEIKKLLCMGSPDFRITGIWGQGGSGKTTIATAIFNQIFNKFRGNAIMVNVRKASRIGGLAHLRERVLSRISVEDLEIRTSNLSGYIKKRLQRMEGFIILEDVNTQEEFDFLAGGLDRFGRGSRIIITTRNRQILDQCRVSHIYLVDRLNYDDL